MCSIKLPNKYFETGSAVCRASMVTISRSGTAGAGCCAAAATVRPSQNAAAPNGTIRNFTVEPPPAENAYRTCNLAIYLAAVKPEFVLSVWTSRRCSVYSRAEHSIQAGKRLAVGALGASFQKLTLWRQRLVFAYSFRPPSAPFLAS